MTGAPFRNETTGGVSMFDRRGAGGLHYSAFEAGPHPPPGATRVSDRGSMASKTQLPTEAEIVKMPNSEYINAVQLRYFRERPLPLQKELRDNAGATTEHLRELSFAPDPADRASLGEKHALELSTRDGERKPLKKIDQSLARIDDGTYG